MIVSASAMPHRMPTGWTLDSGDYAANLDAALELAGYGELRERQATLRAEGRFFGIGLATFSESSGVGPSIGMGSVGFSGPATRAPRGRPRRRLATVFSGTMSTGQGHATSLAQIAADVLGLALGEVEVVQGTPRSCRSGPAPSTRAPSPSAASAVYEAARKLLDEARKIAAHKLQRRPRDLTFEDGVFRPRTDCGYGGGRTRRQEGRGQGGRTLFSGGGWAWIFPPSDRQEP